MAEDGDISRRYRELGREEPPRHVDEAIRAAARRAVGTRPAPLVVPTGRQRWYFPLAAAAVIVLAVAVTLHVEREQPGEELVTAPAEKPKAEEPKAEESQPAPQPERRRKAESADSRQLREAAPPPELQKAPEPAAAPPPPPAQDAISSTQQSAAGAFMGNAETAPRPAPAARPESSPTVQVVPPPPQASAELRRADEAPRKSVLAASAARSPEQWLQGIADLRRQGRHEEADKELAEFRKRYPGHKIPQAALKK